MDKKLRKIRDAVGGMGLPKGPQPARRGAMKMSKRASKAAVKRAVDRVKAAYYSGPGFAADRQLRAFALEFNNRLLRYGPTSMPGSFQVMQAFLVHKRSVGIFELKPERDHLLSFSDFVDFVTGSDAPSDGLGAAAHVPENVIHSYSCLDDPHQLMFSTDLGKNYAVAGVSFVRRGQKVWVMVLGGRSAASDDDLADWSKVQPTRGREHIPPHSSLTEASAFLREYPDLRRTIVLIELDLRGRTISRRFVLTDTGSSYDVITDDATSFATPQEAEEMLAATRERLDDAEVLFELAKTSLLLPSYFAFKYTLVRNETVVAGRRPAKAGRRKRTQRKAARAPAGAERVIYRRVAALRIIGDSTPGTCRRFTPPQFQVEVRGFWRRLPEGQIGRDTDGAAVEGRTWVQEHLRHRDKPPKPIEVLVKSKLAPARSAVQAAP